MSTAWDISTATPAGKTFSISSQQTSPYDFRFNSSGTILVTFGNNGRLHRYNLTTAWDISTAVYSNQSAALSSTVGGSATAFDMNPTGTIAYCAGYTNKTVYQFSLGDNSYPSTHFKVPQVTLGDNRIAAYIKATT